MKITVVGTQSEVQKVLSKLEGYNVEVNILRGVVNKPGPTPTSVNKTPQTSTGRRRMSAAARAKIAAAQKERWAKAKKAA